MRSAVISTALFLGTLGAAAAQTADSAGFIIRLGHDTTAIERYVRTNDHLVAEAVQRSPVTMLHRLVLQLGANGRVTSGEYTTRRPTEQQPVLTRRFTFRGDSVAVETHQGSAIRAQTILARDAIPLIGPFYSPYELAVMRAIASGARADTIPVLAGSGLVGIRVQRVGSDSVTLNNQFDEPMRAHIDPRGRLLHLTTPAYVGLERLRWVDLDRYTRDFATRDEVGKAMGMLSPRSTVRRVIDGASIWIDYGRPAMRGRPVWGGLVPWENVWRMGANDATHIAIDRTMRIGELTLQPGTYTLFLQPSQSGNWQLIVNRGTGMSGLDYKASEDVGRVPLRITQLERPVESFTLDIAQEQGGSALRLAWDRTAASVPMLIVQR